MVPRLSTPGTRREAGQEEIGAYVSFVQMRINIVKIRGFFLLSWDHDTAEEYEVKLSSTYRLVSDPSNPRSGSIFASLCKSVNNISPSKAKRGESPILAPLRKRECMRTAEIGPDLRGYDNIRTPLLAVQQL